MPVHVVGNACVDTTFVVDRFPLAGETIDAVEGWVDLGGKGLNQAVAARRCGADVTLWAAVGDDADGRAIAARLAAEGIVDRLVVTARPSDRSTIVVDAAAENLIVSDVACAAAFDPLAATDLADRLAAGDLVVLQGNLGAGPTRAVVDLARRRGARVVLNPSPLAAGRAVPLAVDVLVANRIEAARLAGTDDPGEAAVVLRRQGAAAVVVTLGADGALICDAEGCVAVPAVAVASRDTSGAGDVVCGVIAALVDAGRDLRTAVPVALAAAAIAVTRPGALAACPTVAEFADLCRRP